MQFADEVRAYTCIRCPLGCRLEVVVDSKGKVADVAGHGCSRGKDYAVSEATDPRRMVTSFVCVEGCMEPLSVKTAAPVPKHLIPDVLEAIGTMRLHAPVKAGDILIEDACGSGIPVVATKTLHANGCDMIL